MIDWVSRGTGLSRERVCATGEVEELGLDSLQMTTLSAEVSDWLGIRVDAEALYEYSTLSDYARWLAAVKSVSDGMTRLKPAERSRLLVALGERQSTSLASTDGEISPDCWDFCEMAPVRALAAREESLLKAMRHNPYFTTHDGINGATTIIDGRES